MSERIQVIKEKIHQSFSKYVLSSPYEPRTRPGSSEMVEKVNITSAPLGTQSLGKEVRDDHEFSSARHSEVN